MHLPPEPTHPRVDGLERLAAAQRAAGAMRGGAKCSGHGALAAQQHVGGGAHGAADQHRLANVLRAGAAQCSGRSTVSGLGAGLGRRPALAPATKLAAGSRQFCQAASTCALRIQGNQLQPEAARQAGGQRDSPCTWPGPGGGPAGRRAWRPCGGPARAPWPAAAVDAKCGGGGGLAGLDRAGLL